MIVFLLTGSAPIVLVALLGLLVYLSWLELRAEPLSGTVKLWWYLLVLLTNLPGYLALRLWLLARRRTT